MPHLFTNRKKSCRPARSLRTFLPTAFLASLLTALLSACLLASRGLGSPCVPYPLSSLSFRGYELSDGFLSPAGETPMLFFEGADNAGAVELELGAPLAADATAMLFFPAVPGGTSYDSMHLVHRYAAAGSDTLRFIVPHGARGTLRLDLYGRFSVKEIRVFPALPFKDLTPALILKCFPVGILAVSFLLYLLLFSGPRSIPGKERRSASPVSAAPGSPSGTEQSAAPGGSGERTLWLDLLRALAALLVITAHTAAPLCTSLPAESLQYRALELLTIFAHTSSLLFVMMSGALILKPTEMSLFTFLKKRLLKVLLPLIAVSPLYTRVMCASVMTPAEHLRAWARMITTGVFPEAPHLWLVYQILFLYLIAWFIAVVLERLPEKGQLVLALLITVSFFFRTADLLAGRTPGPLLFLASWPGIFILGRIFTLPVLRRLDLAVLAAGAGALAFTYRLICTCPAHFAVSTNLSFLMLLMTAALMVLARRTEPLYRFLKKPIGILSRNSYGILLVHWFVLYALVPRGILPAGLSLKARLLLPVALCLPVSALLWSLIDRSVLRIPEFFRRRRAG